MHQLFKHPVGGSIPAYAGEPQRLWQTPEWQRVYPRVCGGTETDHRRQYCPPGLSPRMRGNPALSGAVWGRGWSIPAYAGEPAAAWCAFRRPEVYPRVCGGTATAA